MKFIDLKVYPNVIVDHEYECHSVSVNGYIVTIDNIIIDIRDMSMVLIDCVIYDDINEELMDMIKEFIKTDKLKIKLKSYFVYDELSYKSIWFYE